LDPTTGALHCAESATAGAADRRGFDGRQVTRRPSCRILASNSEDTYFLRFKESGIGCFSAIITTNGTCDNE